MLPDFQPNNRVGALLSLLCDNEKKKAQPHYLQSETGELKNNISRYHTTLFKVSHYPLQSTTPPSSKDHTTLFKVPPYHLQMATRYTI